MVKQTLKDTGNTGFLPQLQQSRDNYEQTIEPFISMLDQILGAIEANQDLQGVSALWEKTKQTYNLFQLYELSGKLSNSKRVVSVLRASSDVPYNVSGSISLPLDTSQSITPSYLQSVVPPPISDDRQPSLLAKFSDPILVKAKDLDHDPIKIFNFVRNQIRLEWYSGAMKGAEETLLQGAGNDVDQAALLVALLRCSGLPARFVHGIVQYPMADLEQQLSISTPSDVITALRKLGVPLEPVLSGNNITALKIPYTWVSAQVPYSNYRGAVVDGSGKLWLGLMPAFKTLSDPETSSILKDMTFDAKQLQNQYFSTIQTQEPIAEIHDQVQSYLTKEKLGSFEDLIKGPAIDNDALGYLPNSLPLTVINTSWESAAVPDSLVHQFHITIYSGNTKSISSRDR